VAGRGTIFPTTHILEIVERLCDHLGVIRDGALGAQGAAAALRGQHGTLEEASCASLAPPQIRRSRPPSTGWYSDASLTALRATPLAPVHQPS
jgi:ABC-type multidrug transport system ATPase subunit